jgi:hypothetical protein
LWDLDEMGSGFSSLGKTKTHMEKEEKAITA